MIPVPQSLESCVHMNAVNTSCVTFLRLNSSTNSIEGTLENDALKELSLLKTHSRNILGYSGVSRFHPFLHSLLFVLSHQSHCFVLDSQKWLN